jgi:hypothetical protein
MKPLCEYCGTRHESYQGHVFASNTASNKVTASNNASNKGQSTAVEVAVRDSSGDREDVGVVRVESGAGRVGGGVVEGVPKQRWSRESYNAYQREYMRKKRALGRD